MFVPSTYGYLPGYVPPPILSPIDPNATKNPAPALSREQFEALALAVGLVWLLIEFG